ncbi:hypothetical protein R1flu_009115 [Riccia fluitans]|uniref:Uncharacterized protein n=1 Tax=Riccia fluitans TaxID=41844 RepID=A0ABD1Z1C9_9MARC
MDEIGRLHSRRLFNVSPSVEVLPSFVDRFWVGDRILFLKYGFRYPHGGDGWTVLRTRVATQLCVIDSVHVP